MDIICHAFPAWEGNYLKSTVELMKCLAVRHRVLYVDYTYTWTDFFKSFLGKSPASWQRMLGLAPRLRRIQLENGAAIQVLTLPPVLPCNFLRSPRLHDAVNRFNGLFIRHSIQQAQVQLAIQEPVVVNAFNPGFGLLVAGRLNESRLVYYCYDEISAAAWAGRHGARLEREFLKKCDGVAVSSLGLLRSKSELHDRVSLVKNGVDFDLFQREIPITELPVVLGLLAEQPVIGYLGSVDDRLDFELLEQLFAAFPKYQFLFVGRVQSEAIQRRLAQYPNVYSVGAQAPAQLPGWVQRMDVCLIPFVKNKFTAGIYPLKVNEYLACGKPVVSTHFSDLSDFQDVIAVTDDADAFLAAVAAAVGVLADGGVLRRTFAAKNSWQARAAVLEEVLLG